MNLDADQQACVDVLEGPVLIVAGPGTGKTRVTVARYLRLRELGVSDDDILSLTFTAEAAAEMASRSGVADAKKVFRTFHSFVLDIMQKERERVPFHLKPAILPFEFEDYELRQALVKMYPIVRKADDLKEYISTQKRLGYSPDESLAREHGIGEFYAQAYRDYERKSRAEGWLDFDSLMVEAVNLLETNEEVRGRYTKKFIQVDEAQDTDPIQLKLLKLIFMGNIMFVGDANQCQPPGTMVRVLERAGCGGTKSLTKEVSIEQLNPDQKLVSWDCHEKRICLGIGRNFKKAERFYNGDLLTIFSDGKSTRMTPNHFVWAKFNKKELEEGEKNYFVYLMWKKSLGFRIGTSRFRRTCGANQVSHRGYQETADRMWILTREKSQAAAETTEEILSLQYGIPECVFHNKYKGSKKTPNQIKRIFKAANPYGGFECLGDRGLLFEHPFIAWERPRKKLTKFHGYFKTVAANLLPGLMELPTTTSYKSSVIEKIERKIYSGVVYSLDVEKDHTYVADGIPVGNSIYEWRGAHPDIMGSIPQMFPGTKTLYLGNNYRSTGALVEFFKEILPVDNGLASHMRTANPAGESPTFTHYADDYQEAAQVLRRVTDPENTAIIARTNRQIFRFQQACFNAGIKCKILGKKAFWEQNEVKQLLSLAKNAKMPEGYTAPMVLKALVIQHRFLEKYKFSGNPLDSDPADNINSLYKMSAKYQTVKEFLDFIRRLTYGSKSRNTPCLTLATVHQAKGKEFRHVFLVGVTEGILPHSKATHVEEKRLFFVGASRAAERLCITCYRNPSMFLNAYQDKIARYVPEAIGHEPRKSDVLTVQCPPSAV